MQRFPSFHRNSSTSGVHNAREHLSDILDRHYSASVAAPASAPRKEKRPEKSGGEERSLTPTSNHATKKADRMPSSKGEPTDPELREQVKEEVKAEGKGGGPGKWSAWKSGEMARRYEDQGGDYIDTGENKNKAQKGAPEKK